MEPGTTEDTSEQQQYNRQVEYSGQKKPLVRNGGNRNTDFKETILIVLIFAQFRMLGPRGILNLVRASHSQTSISKGTMYMRMRDAGLIQP